MRYLLEFYMDTKQGCVKSNGWQIVVVTVMLVFLIYKESNATHLRAGEIIAERVNCSSNQFKITVTVYTNTRSTARFGGDGEILDFGDGTSEPVPQTENTPRPDLDAEGIVGTASYVTYHTYPSLPF